MAELSRIVRAAIRDEVGPVLRAAGYRGRGGTWRRYDARGDLSLFQIALSPWNSATSVTVDIHIAVVPLPCWEHRLDGPTPPDHREPQEPDGVVRERMEPSDDRRGGWQCADEAEVPAMVRSMADRLSTYGLAWLDELGDRERLIPRLWDGAGFHFFTSMWSVRVLALVELLADDGGPEFERACAAAAGLIGPGNHPAFNDKVEETIAWARRRQLSSGERRRPPDERTWP